MSISVNSVLQLVGAVRVGPGEYYNSTDYRLPASGEIITVTPRRDYSGVVLWTHRQTTDTDTEGLWALCEKLERPAIEARQKAEEEKAQREYDKWSLRFQKLAAALNEDSASAGVAITYTFHSDPVPGHKFPDLAVKMVMEGGKLYEAWATFADTGKVIRGGISSQEFTGTPSFNRLVKRYFGLEV